MNKYILTISMLLATVLGFSQFEKKLNAHAFIGLPFIPKGEGTSSENVLNGYGQLPVFGLGANYAFNTKLSTQGDLRLLYTSKDNGVYSLFQVAIDLQMKYNFIHSDKGFSPYVIGGVSLGSVHVTQKENTEKKTEFSDYGESEVGLLDLEKRNPEVKLTMFPSLGLVAGAGVDFTYKKRVGLSLGLMYTTSNIHNHVLMKEYFPENESKFNYLYLQAGIKLAFLSSKSAI